jgi:hypothetical protein
MKKIVFQIVLAVLCLSAQAQKVSNIRAEQRGQDIVVFYSLETYSLCKVTLFLSQDDGVTWSLPLKNVSGDVGMNIDSGEKMINWKVLEEREQIVSDKVKFKVIAMQYGIDEKMRGSGQVTACFKLEGRSIKKAPRPFYKCIEVGTVVINISVDEFGKVSRAEIDETLSSSDNCLRSESLAHARDWLFSSSSNNRQFGRITFTFMAP